MYPESVLRGIFSNERGTPVTVLCCQAFLSHSTVVDVTDAVLGVMYRAYPLAFENRGRSQK